MVGAVSGNSGSEGLDGVIRTSTGDWIVGFCHKSDYPTNVEAELLAIQEGLKIAALLNVANLQIESDSHALYILQEQTNLDITCRSQLKLIPTWVFKPQGSEFGG